MGLVLEYKALEIIGYSNVERAILSRRKNRRRNVSSSYPERSRIGSLRSPSGTTTIPHRIVGMLNSAPSLVPEGQREVTVLVLV